MNEPASLEIPMRAALDEARAALAHGDVPIGAVVLSPEGRVVAAEHNQREARGDPTAHAEMLALSAAAQGVPGWRLEGHTLVVTLEPCAMCAGAAVAARIAHVVYGATDPKAGACWSLYNIPQDARLNHRCRLTAGVLEADCARLLEEFFAARRQGGPTPTSR